ncbi:MAG: shikimate dehydrogenase, partial [Proteobacteria bacterium]|nr:shikimate dehydrogenase [Pseudomonadota bacterium]
MAERDQYVVIGNPIEHSKSPQIHSMFAEQTGEAIEYKKILCPLGGFSRVVTEFFA